MQLSCSIASNSAAEAAVDDQQQPSAAAAAVDAQQQQQQPPGSDEVWDYVTPQHVLERNQRFVQERLSGRVILAPLTKGGNLPFRRLCCHFDPELPTVSEMAFARQLVKGDRVERARLYRAANEPCFGVQIATNNIAEGVKAAKLAQDAGAAWLDINCGCPIYEATKRGLGAALLRKPTKLANMVAGIAAQVDLPITVKIRTGESEKKLNAPRVVRLLHQAGAAAVVVHGRTMEQRYKKAADWSLLSELVQSNPGLPVIGNGDILTHYEAADRWQRAGFTSLMVGRGALIKPWIFQEIGEGRELLLTASDRVGVYRQLVSYMKEHFRDDARGKIRAFYFWPWHFSFFCRYRPLPADVYAEQSRQHPLIATRPEGVADPRVGESEDTLPIVERLLRCENEAAHQRIADVLWDAASDAEAMQQLEQLGRQELSGWEQQLRERGSGDRSSEEAAVAG